MRELMRRLAVFLCAAMVLTCAAERARADLGGTDLTVMQTLAKPISQGGYGWGPAFGWDYTTNPCPSNGINWNGVVCIHGFVQSIIADCQGILLNAQLPPILNQLGDLTTFESRGCGYWGPLPDLSNLTDGPIPPNTRGGNLSSLRLDPNALSGPIPAWLATGGSGSNWPATLGLAGNRFSGQIPVISSAGASSGSCFVQTGLDGNNFSSIDPNWTLFNRTVSNNCVAPLPASCSSNSCPYSNTCTPQRSSCSGQVNLAAVSGQVNPAPVPGPVNLAAVSGDGQWTQIGTAFASPIEVLVTDSSGNPVPGQTVTFSGPGILTATAVSNGSGIASATVQANSTVGGNTVTASVAGTIVPFGLTSGLNAACSGYISVTSASDGGPGSLREALAEVCPGGTVDLGPIAGQSIALSPGVSSYNFNGRLYIGDSVTIMGHGVTISGSGKTRIFFVEGGNVTLQNLVLANGLGLGGSSQFGGSGAGMGGAVFQNGGTLTLSGVTLSNNAAQGGSPDMSGSQAGGGFGGGSSGGDLGGTAGPADGAGGPADTSGGWGGFGAGGGFGTTFFAATGGSTGTLGGIGGFGGSGGGGATGNIPNRQNSPYGNLNSGFGGGWGAGTAAASGGAGFGGAIFARNGILNLFGSAFTGNQAIGGTGAQGKGGSLFIYENAVLNLDAATTFSGSVAASAGVVGQNFSDMIYNPQSTCPGSDTVDLCGQTSNYFLTAPASATYNSSFNVTPSSASGATPALTVLSGPCSISGTTVTVTGASGDCIVQVSWPASGNYLAATLTARVAIQASANACLVPSAGLTAWFKGEGNTNDVTGLYNGAAGGALAYAPGEVGQAFSLNGSNSFVSIPSAVFPYPASTAFSFEGWFNTVDNGVILGLQSTVTPYTATGGHYTPAIYVGTDGKLYAQLFYNGFYQTVSPYTVNDGSWHHVAVTYDGTTETTYLDGVSIGSQTFAQAADGPAPYFAQLGAGDTNGSWPNTPANAGWFTFNGLIDEATVYSTVLTPAQVLAIAGAGQFGKCLPATLSVGKSHTGTFTQGQTAEWDITVSNTGSGSTSAATSVSDTLPAGYTLSSYSSTSNAWSCTSAANAVSCNSAQTVAGGSGFPTLKLIVNVPANSAVSVSNSAGAWGGGDPVHASAATPAISNTDLATVVQVPASVSINGNQTQQTPVGLAFGSLAVTVKDAGGATIATYSPVTFTATTGGNGQSGTFGNGTGATSIAANASGIADPGSFAANGKAGSYSVGVTAGSATATFNLTNTDAQATVTSLTSTIASGRYTVGAVIPIKIAFTKPVNVAGTPLLALNSGAAASYTSGSGTASLTFTYTVGAGQNSAALDASSTAALSLNGGTIADSSGTGAALTLPAPGASGSLSAAETIVIDTVSPTVVSYSVKFGSESYNVLGSNRNRLPWQISGITVVFSKPIAAATVASLGGVTATGISGVGTTTVTWTISPFALGTLATTLAGSGANAVKDAAGNALAGGTGFSQNIKVLWGDFNDDGAVNSQDLALITNAEAAPYNIFADLNGDGAVTSADVLIVRSRLGTSLP